MLKLENLNILECVFFNQKKTGKANLMFEVFIFRLPGLGLAVPVLQCGLDRLVRPPLALQLPLQQQQPRLLELQNDDLHILFSFWGNASSNL
jgi:hypothetical protein